MRITNRARRRTRVCTCEQKDEYRFETYSHQPANTQRRDPGGLRLTVHKVIAVEWALAVRRTKIENIHLLLAWVRSHWQRMRLRAVALVAARPSTAKAQ